MTSWADNSSITASSCELLLLPLPSFDAWCVLWRRAQFCPLCCLAVCLALCHRENCISLNLRVAVFSFHCNFSLLRAQLMAVCLCLSTRTLCSRVALATCTSNRTLFCLLWSTSLLVDSLSNIQQSRKSPSPSHSRQLFASRVARRSCAALRPLVCSNNGKHGEQSAEMLLFSLMCHFHCWRASLVLARWASTRPPRPLSHPPTAFPRCRPLSSPPPRSASVGA